MTNKKQLFNLFEDIVAINNDVWDNKPGTYNAERSAALLIEEALEKLPLTDRLASILGCENTPKQLARLITELTTGDNVDGTINEDVTDVGAMDADLDSIYIAVGNLHMQGLTPHQMVDGLQVVHNANLQKLGAKDEQGKIVKPVGFVPPESQLQLILDNRTTK